MARGTFGERLKRERELREVTLDEITSATRIGPRFLEALENEEWEKLPGGVFNRGFVRSVARYLGLDEEALLGEYDLAHGAQVPPQAERVENRITRPAKWIPFAVFVVVIVLLIGLITGGIYAWRHYSAQHTAKPAVTLPSETPPAGAPASDANAASPALVQPPASPAPSSEQPLDLYISMSAASHVRVVADGILLLDAELPTGDNRHFSATDHFDVTATNSSAVLLELNGQTMPPLGAPAGSGTITLARKDLRQASGGNSQP